MRQLIVPATHAGRGVEAYECVAEQPGARPVAAVEVIARRADRQVQESAPLIERHRRPDVGVPGVVVRTLAPGVGAELAVARHGVEGPALLAGARIVGTHVAR